MAAFASQQPIDGLENTSYYQDELDRIRNRGASLKGSTPQGSGGGGDFLDGWLDFYNKQKSPIYDGKGNQIGFDHGYGVRENWEPQKPGDDKWISDEEWEQIRNEPSPPSDQRWPDREPPGGVDWTQPITQDPPVGAAPGTRIGDDGRNLVPSGRSDYGSRIGGDPSMGYTMDWRDSDGDGTDDRHQSGPGQPDEGPFSDRGRQIWEDREPTSRRPGRPLPEGDGRPSDPWPVGDGRPPRPRPRPDDGDVRPYPIPGPRPDDGDVRPWPIPGPRPPKPGPRPPKPGPRPSDPWPDGDGRPYPMPGPRPEIPPIHGDPGPRPPIDGGWTPGKPIVSKEQEVIESFYNNILGRGSDQGGMDYWLGQAEGGMSLADIEKSIASSKEAKAGRPQPPDDPNDWLVPFGDDQEIPGTFGKDVKYPAFDDKGRDIRYDEQNRPTTNPGVGDEDYRQVHIDYAEGFDPTPEEHRQNQKRFWTETEGPLKRLGIKRQEEARRLEDKAQEIKQSRGERPLEKKAAKERAEEWQNREERRLPKQNWEERILPKQNREERRLPKKSQEQVNREVEVRRENTRRGEANRDALVRAVPSAPAPAPEPSRPVSKPKSDWLEQAYQSNLGRSADAGGKDYWAKEVSSGRQTKDQVIANIRRSDEYKNRNR